MAEGNGYGTLIKLPGRRRVMEGKKGVLSRYPGEPLSGSHSRVLESFSLIICLSPISLKHKICLLTVSLIDQVIFIRINLIGLTWVV